MTQSKNDQFDPSQNYLEDFPHPLDAFFYPESIALIGATETSPSVGRTILHNLIDSPFKGRILPVNPKYTSLMGIPCYPDVLSIDGSVDLAVIVTPAKSVYKIVEQCGNKGVRAVIIISAGFKELGEAGEKLEKEVVALARSKGMRIIGPNCLGIMNPLTGLNATFAAGGALPGKIAFISQSGAMCTAVLDWSLKEKIGFSAFVSVGSMADIDWGNLIEYLGQQEETNSILLYMETIGNARSFLSAAKQVSLTKPIIVIKAGRTEAAAKAAASHTGSLSGSDEVFASAMQRVGVLRVSTIDELFNMALALGKQPLPKGPRLAMITNAGGPGVLATDAAVTFGAEMAVLDQETILKLSQFLPEAWSHANPIDVLGDASPERYAKVLEVIGNDPKVDGILAILSPQDVTDPTKTAEALIPYASKLKKPILASWMGGGSVEKGAELLANAGIPTFTYPDSASKTFGMMWEYRKELDNLYITPAIRDEIDSGEEISRKHLIVNEIIDKARKEKRTLLTEFESKQILSAYDIPTVETIIASSVPEAVAAAAKLGYPVVVKLHSETLTHKSDVGGVKLNLKEEKQVEEAFTQIAESVARHAGKEHFHGVTVQKMISFSGYELILGSSVDPQFGPVLLFGTGGTLVEIYKDRSLFLPPLNATLAKRMMEKTKVYEALKGVRGKAGIDFAKLETILVSFSQLIAEQPWIAECDINPLLVSGNNLVALDARILLHPPEMKKEELPKLAIRPYPIEYVSHTTLKNKYPVTLRPVRPEDEPLVIEFHKNLSENTVRQRYFAFLSLSERTAHDRLIRLCNIDYDKQVGIIAEIVDQEEKKIIGFIRMWKISGTQDGDFKLIISDEFHNLGLGTQLTQKLIEIGKKENIKTLRASVLAENLEMIALYKKLGFQVEKSSSDKKIVYISLQL